MSAQLPHRVDLRLIPLLNLLAAYFVAGLAPSSAFVSPVAARLRARNIVPNIFPKYGENHETPAPAPHFAALRIAVVVRAMTGRPAPRLGSESA